MRKRLGLCLAIGLCLTLVVEASYAQEQAEPSGTESADPAASAPDTLVIDSISKLYEEVVFTHSSHVDYADSCATCHHHSPAGETPSCSKCHSASTIVKKGDNPLGLKGAYHQQCMNCHKEMDSGPVGCTDCHAKKSKKDK